MLNSAYALEPCYFESVADAAAVDGGLVYRAGKDYRLKPVVGEAYGQDVGTSYYAVAVVKANSNLTINSLRGAKSCHTALNRTAGWNVPIGFLLDSGRMPVVDCHVAQAAGEFFKSSCVPGANGAGYPPSLCELCKGNATGQGRCEPNPQEEYYDYLGAFRCLVDGAGEVAFVKHSTVAEALEGPAASSWGEGFQLQDFQLLCRDGSRAAVTAWRTCHLARVPAHAVVARADTDGALIFQLLDQGQQRFDGEDSTFQMFDSTAYGGKNLLFKDATTELVPIMEQTYQAWLGDEYLHAMRGLDCDPASMGCLPPCHPKEGLWLLELSASPQRKQERFCHHWEEGGHEREQNLRKWKELGGGGGGRKANQLYTTLVKGSWWGDRKNIVTTNTRHK